MYWLSSVSDVKDLLRNLKKVSPGYELPDDNRKTNPQEIVDLIFRQLEKLKLRSLDPTFDDRSDVDDEILKQVYDKSVSALLKAPANLQRIEAIFNGFKFDVVAAQPREILIVLLLDSQARLAFERYLTSKAKLSSRRCRFISTR